MQYEETLHGDGEVFTLHQFERWLVNRLQASLPSSWSLAATSHVAEREGLADQASDLLLRLVAPTGEAAQITVTIRRTVEPRAVRSILSQVVPIQTERASVLVAAPFLSERTRDLLARADLNYLDATGALRLRLDQPALYIERPGASHNPWSTPQTQRSLSGPAAGRVVRALCDVRPPYGVRELARYAQTPPGTVTKILGLLDREALIQRAMRGKYQGAILTVEWQALLRRWTQDYAFATSNRTSTYLEPRGLDVLLTKLKRRSMEVLSNHAAVKTDLVKTESVKTESVASGAYAITGSFASVHYAPVVQPRLLTLYVPDRAVAASTLGLRLAERGVNVLLAEPSDPVVFARTTQRGDLTYAALSQVAADLLTGPGRGPQEATALLHWMEAHEDDWRQ